MVPQLKWLSEDNNTKRAKIRPLTYYLYAGKNLIGWVAPSGTGKTYYSIINIQMDNKPKDYMPLEDIMYEVEKAVSNWFEDCFVEIE